MSIHRIPSGFFEEVLYTICLSNKKLVCTWSMNIHDVVHTLYLYHIPSAFFMSTTLHIEGFYIIGQIIIILYFNKCILLLLFFFLYNVIIFSIYIFSINLLSNKIQEKAATVLFTHSIVINIINYWTCE